MLMAIKKSDKNRVCIEINTSKNTQTYVIENIEKWLFSFLVPRVEKYIVKLIKKMIITLGYRNDW